MLYYFRGYELTMKLKSYLDFLFFVSVTRFLFLATHKLNVIIGLSDRAMSLISAEYLNEIFNQVENITTN